MFFNLPQYMFPLGLLHIYLGRIIPVLETLIVLLLIVFLP